jgi:hypothetical protein
MGDWVATASGVEAGVRVPFASWTWALALSGKSSSVVTIVRIRRSLGPPRVTLGLRWVGLADSGNRGVGVQAGVSVACDDSIVAHVDPRSTVGTDIEAKDEQAREGAWDAGDTIARAPTARVEGELDGWEGDRNKRPTSRMT